MRNPTPKFQLDVGLTETDGCRKPIIHPSAYAVIGPLAAGVEVVPPPTSIATNGPVATSLQLS